MAKSILMVATREQDRLSSTLLGFAHALERQGHTIAVHCPFAQSNDVALIQTLTRAPAPAPIALETLQQAVAQDKLDELMEVVIQNFERAHDEAEIVLIEGLLPTLDVPYAAEVNQKLARALSADVVLVSTATDTLARLENLLDYAASGFGGYDEILGLIIRDVGAEDALDQSELAALKREGPRFIAAIPEQVRAEDERLEDLKAFLADPIACDWLPAYLHSSRPTRLAPAAFRYQIVQRAIKAHKAIVLPEGDEPRTVVAANQCAARHMATCVLLAKEEAVRQVAAQQGIALHPELKIIDPDAVRERYVPRLVELRKKKGMDEATARQQLADNVVLGTMMLEAGEVDGLVSGAVHTTANTIRPPFQIIKTAPGANIVSSVFFMCLPDQVLVYGDCAVNPNPSAEDLAQIAIQSHDTARAFGIQPKVAMISYSTGTSGSGEDVEKVKAATAKVRELRPDIVVDGPLQYDAAAVESVGKQKAPNSPVAGQATVFIFPDLNTGNTTYKAVQRSAHAIAMGPVLQGMRKPVNDLSRGALIEDIIYTIAITAAQAAELDG